MINKQIQEIFVLAIGFRRSNSSKRAVLARLHIVRLPAAWVNNYGVKWMLVCSIRDLSSSEREGSKTGSC